MILKKLFAFALLASAQIAFADELFLTHAELRAQGFVPSAIMPSTLSGDNVTLPEAHSLAWPVKFQDAQHSMGNVMVQYQNYGGEPYFHGGCDLRTEVGEWILAPVAGHLEAGHYAYETNEDGSLTKSIKPWPATGNRMYFELAVVREDGLRFEFHHVDRDTLPPEIVAGLDAGNATVTAGTPIGRVVSWPENGVDGQKYHHTHYNIVLPNGTHLNPEYYSPLLPSTLGPTVSGVYAIQSNGYAVNFKDSDELNFHPKEFVVATSAKIDDDVYVHAPEIAQITFVGGPTVGWDFSRALLDRDGKFPNIASVFMESLRTPEGRTLRTKGNYHDNFFLIRIPVPSGAKGMFLIQIDDAAGNGREIKGMIQ